MSLDRFLERNRIGRDTWEKASLEWSTLQAIADDHSANTRQLHKSAEMFASVIQSFPGVHSVRWRVKNGEHLLEKIIRKRADASPKYATIDAENYFCVVTDLVGVRALHLFKTDCLDLDRLFRSTWALQEQPVAYIRAGDQDDLVNKFKASDFDVREHPAGYRSVHYVFESQPIKRRLLTEVQVRTVFEEGWSEIDHHVRYPNFSNDPLVAYFLTIFNRMAGSADEMGAFVRGLAATLGNLSSEVSKANADKAASLAEIEKATAQIESLRKQDTQSSAVIAKLKSEVQKLKAGPKFGAVDAAGIYQRGHDGAGISISPNAQNLLRLVGQLLQGSPSENAPVATIPGPIRKDDASEP